MNNDKDKIRSHDKIIISVSEHRIGNIFNIFNLLLILYIFFNRMNQIQHRYFIQDLPTDFNFTISAETDK
ncbi:MAG: hypothetical protein BWK80_45030 [Desulfobacteraceae bacterium IS3]|nr:MAG: hypothetical protein BWK80_45030 [Desulfobacteraceae bacterium IS3]